jgi:hypothetical protein
MGVMAQSVYDILDHGAHYTRTQIFARSAVLRREADVTDAVRFINLSPLSQFTDSIVIPIAAPWEFWRTSRSNRAKYRQLLARQRYARTMADTARGEYEKAIAQGGVTPARLQLLSRQLANAQMMLHLADVMVTDAQVLLALP